MRGLLITVLCLALTVGMLSTAYAAGGGEHAAQLVGASQVVVKQVAGSEAGNPAANREKASMNTAEFEEEFLSDSAVMGVVAGIAILGFFAIKAGSSSSM